MSTGISWLQDISNVIDEWGGKEQSTCILHVSPFAHTCAPLFDWTALTKDKFEDKSAKTFKMVTAAHIT